jgi:hypothetical protein
MKYNKETMFADEFITPKKYRNLSRLDFETKCREIFHHAAWIKVNKKFLNKNGQVPNIGSGINLQN